MLAGEYGGGRPVPPMRPESLLEPLSESEVRVLRVRHMYVKFGTHHRAGTVELARALGLLAPPELVARPLGRNEKWPETGATEPFWKMKIIIQNGPWFPARRHYYLMRRRMRMAG
jgi:hypothetical protein